jgi:lysophospholipid acyltransferase (LPLAT)-like uncharacterized protein
VSARDRFLVTVIPPLGAALVRALGRTLRIELLGAEQLVPLWRSAQPIVYGVWHGQLLMLPFVNERLRRTHGARRVHVLASRSRDGEMLARFVERFGLGVTRGSSSRGGADALRRLTRRIRAGDDVAVAPDGPRGPRERCQPGIVALAALSGGVLVPTAFAASPVWRLSSWDTFEVPRPWARGALAFGPPLPVTGEPDREGLRAALESGLEDATRAARRAVGRQ